MTKRQSSVINKSAKGANGAEHWEIKKDKRKETKETKEKEGKKRKKNNKGDYNPLFFIATIITFSQDNLCLKEKESFSISGLRLR